GEVGLGTRAPTTWQVIRGGRNAEDRERAGAGDTRLPRLSHGGGDGGGRRWGVGHGSRSLGRVDRRARGDRAARRRSATLRRQGRPPGGGERERRARPRAPPPGGGPPAHARRPADR